MSCYRVMCLHAFVMITAHTITHGKFQKQINANTRFGRSAWGRLLSKCVGGITPHSQRWWREPGLVNGNSSRGGIPPKRITQDLTPSIQECIYSLS